MLDILVEDNGSFFDHEGDDKLRKLQNTLLNYNDVNELSGLCNIHKRAKLFFGEKSGIALGKSELGGLGVRLRLVFKEDL